MENVKKLNLPIITATIAILPFYGYFVAYVFESTYLGALGIPSEFVQINISSAFLVIVTLILLTTLISVISTFFLPLLKRHRKGFITYPLIFSGLIISLVLSFVYIFSPSFKSEFFPIASIIFGFYFLNEFIYPIIKFRTFKNYKRHVMEERLKKSKIKKSGFGSQNVYFQLVVAIFFVLLLTYTIISSLAGAYVQNYNSFLTFSKNGKNYAIIRNYGNEKIAIEYKGEKLIPGSVYIFNSDEMYLSAKKINLARRPNSFKLPFFQ